MNELITRIIVLTVFCSVGGGFNYYILRHPEFVEKWQNDWFRELTNASSERKLERLKAYRRQAKRNFLVIGLLLVWLVMDVITLVQHLLPNSIYLSMNITTLCLLVIAIFGGFAALSPSYAWTMFNSALTTILCKLGSKGNLNVNATQRVQQLYRQNRKAFAEQYREEIRSIQLGGIAFVVMSAVLIWFVNS